MILSADTYVRWNISRSSNTSSEILSQLSNDVAWQLRWAVADNSNTSLEILDKLSTDENLYVRYSVMKNPVTNNYIIRYGHYREL
jgi:uncharacterized protein (UPF0147 family)